MTNNNAFTRRKIFNAFSKNLETIKSHPDIGFIPDFKNGYICPLCFDPFFISDLDNNSPNPLTIEHVPPESLGGKPILLTCKKCNSISGHSLDVHLLKKIEEIDALEFLPNVAYRTSFKSESSKMNGKVEIDKDGHLCFDLKPEWSNPKETYRFMKEIFPGYSVHNSKPQKNKSQIGPYNSNLFSIEFPNFSNDFRAEVALLRIGYLLAFNLLGNAFLISGNLFRVREQILNPAKKILPRQFGINYEFPERISGVNLIKTPKELRCFLVVFYLESSSLRRQFAIVLPGPSVPGIEIYDNLKSVLSNYPDSIHLEIEHIEDMDFVNNLENAWGAHWFWQKYCEDRDENINSLFIKSI
jgi:hypothetical protein